MQLLRGKQLELRGARIGHRVGIGRNVTIEHPQHMTIGHDVTIMERSYLHCLSSAGVRIGHNTSFHVGFWLHCGGELGHSELGFFHIGNYCFVGPGSLMGAGGGITIGDHVQFGPMVSIHAENHRYEDPNRRIREQGVHHGGVMIEDDCWIGAKAVILDGVRVGRGSVIGAASVVTRDVPSYSVAVGNPAQVIRRRE